MLPGKSHFHSTELITSVKFSADTAILLSQNTELFVPVPVPDLLMPPLHMFFFFCVLEMMLSYHPQLKLKVKMTFYFPQCLLPKCISGWIHIVYIVCRQYLQCTCVMVCDYFPSLLLFLFFFTLEKMVVYNHYFDFPHPGSLDVSESYH